MSGSGSPSPDVVIINQLLSDYTTYLSAAVVTKTSLANAGTAWASVITSILADPETDALEVVWAFFVANQNGVLQQNVVSSCCNSLDAQTQNTVKLVYTLFQFAATGVDIATIVMSGMTFSMIETQLNCSALIQFLINNTAPATSSLVIDSPGVEITSGSTVTVTENIITIGELTYPFLSPLLQWSIVHNLGRFPPVMIVTTAGDVVFADVHYIDANSLTVDFGYPEAGTAYLT